MLIFYYLIIGVYDKPTNIEISNPILQSTTRDSKPKNPITLNTQSTSKTGVDLSDVTNIQNSSQNKLKTSSENETNTELVISAKTNKEKEKEELKRYKEKEKEELKKQKEEEKRIKKEKEEKAKEKARTRAKDKLKKEKEEKQKKQEKQKNEGKQKKEEKSKKEKKDKSLKPVASVTIDAEAVESTQRNLQNEITPFAKVNTREVQQTVDNQTRNVRNKAQASQAQPDTSFSSSWDMVAAHRQNLQREVKTPMNNNLRSMSNQNKATTTPANPSKIDRNGFKAQTTMNEDNNSENSDTEA